jgi:hypothetical protein
MLTGKRLGLQQKSLGAAQPSKNKLSRFRDFLRLRHPLKFDFCRMTLDELVNMVDSVLQKDHKSPEIFKPLVAIGHTKDLVDFETVKAFLAVLRDKGVGISTLEAVYPRCLRS